jgi:hypothetical protein
LAAGSLLAASQASFLSSNVLEVLERRWVVGLRSSWSRTANVSLLRLLGTAILTVLSGLTVLVVLIVLAVVRSVVVVVVSAIVVAGLVVRLSRGSGRDTGASFVKGS